MQEQFKILFATNFSDPCFRAVPAIAQLADQLNVRLTLLHVYDRLNGSRAEAEKQIHSFFAEAEHYGSCRRIVTDGEPAEVIERFSRQEPVDLIAAPAAERIGLPRFGHRSLRGRLLDRVPAPLWTMGSEARKRNFSQPIRNIGCWVDLENDNINHVKMASRLAGHLGATLHLLHTVPAIHEGLLASALTSDRPLEPNVARERLEEFTRLLPVPIELHVETGEEKQELPKMLAECDADLVFLGDGQALRTGFGSPRPSKVLRSLPCSAICVDGASRFGTVWPLGQRSEVTLDEEAAVGASVGASLRPAEVRVSRRASN